MSFVHSSPRTEMSYREKTIRGGTSENDIVIGVVDQFKFPLFYFNYRILKR